MRKLTTEEFILKAKEVHGNKYDYSKVQYKNNKEKVEIICPVHGSFWLIAKHHLNGCGCPMCNSSKGKNIIKNYLDKNNINYLSQYEINVPKNIRISSKAYIDFYLPNYNIFIEYNGELHYVPKEYFGGQSAFEYLQLRDNFLLEYCKNNNIKLIVISYKEKDIENYLALNLKLKKMKQYYFYDSACDKKGIIKAQSKKDCLIKFINIASQYDNKFIEDMFNRLSDAEIEFINLDGLKVYE